MGDDSERLTDLTGVIAKPPYILARNEATASILQSTLHIEVAQVPLIIVPLQWPQNVTDDALIVTPLKIIGSDKRSSFAITTPLSDNARRVLDAAIRRVSANETVSQRTMAIATGLNRREVTKAVDELQANNIVARKDDSGHLKLKIGRWRPDPAMCKAAGLEIKEYK